MRPEPYFTFCVKVKVKIGIYIIIGIKEKQTERIHDLGTIFTYQYCHPIHLQTLHKRLHIVQTVMQNLQTRA